MGHLAKKVEEIMKRSFTLRIMILSAVVAIVRLSSTALIACSWDSIVQKCHPWKGEVVVYKHNDCKGSQYYSFNGSNQMEYADFTTLSWPDGTSLNDSVSSVQVLPQ